MIGLTRIIFTFDYLIRYIFYKEITMCRAAAAAARAL